MASDSEKLDQILVELSEIKDAIVLLPTTSDIVAALNTANIPVNVKQVNSVSVKGSGTQIDPWTPL